MALVPLSPPLPTDLGIGGGWQLPFIVKVNKKRVNLSPIPKSMGATSLLWSCHGISLHTNSVHYKRAKDHEKDHNRGINDLRGPYYPGIIPVSCLAGGLQVDQGVNSSWTEVKKFCLCVAGFQFLLIEWRSGRNILLRVSINTNSLIVPDASG